MDKIKKDENLPNKEGNNIEDFNFEGEREATTFLIHMIAGSIAGLMEHVVLFPIDTIKVHMQTSSKRNGIFKTAKVIYSQGGFKRFWKGSMLIGTACVPAHSLYFSIYEVAKHHTGVNNSGFQFMASAITGAVATVFHDVIITPADMIKQRIQLTGSNKCLDCAKNILKTEGISSFFRSLPITVLMNAPYSTTTVMVNENLKKIVKPHEKEYKFLSYFFCAAFAGAVASAVTCPMDIIKTKLQTQNTTSTCEKLDNLLKETNINTNQSKIELKNNVTLNTFSTINKSECHTNSSIKYKNIFSTVKYIYNNEGFFRGFFRGVTPRIINNSPSCAISWGTYELVKHLLLGNRNK